MKHKKHYKNNNIDKLKNNAPIRVLYKTTGQPPETKIIDNVSRLKKAIVKRKLDIIPYEELYIICNNRKSVSKAIPNIVLTFSSVYGDLILVGIDKKEREFKGLSQEDIIWYSQDLMNKSTNNTLPTNKKPINKKNTTVYEREIEKDNSSSKSLAFDFERALISVLMSIEMTLSTLLRNGDKK